MTNSELPASEPSKAAGSTDGQAESPSGNNPQQRNQRGRNRQNPNANTNSNQNPNSGQRAEGNNNRNRKKRTGRTNRNRPRGEEGGGNRIDPGNRALKPPRVITEAMDNIGNRALPEPAAFVENDDDNFGNRDHFNVNNRFPSDSNLIGMEDPYQVGSLVMGAAGRSQGNRGRGRGNQNQNQNRRPQGQGQGQGHL